MRLGDAAAVLKILQATMEPYSTNDILQKCGKDVGKAKLQKSLDSLVMSGEIAVKAFGKLNVYYIKQDNEENDDESNIRLDIGKLEKSYKDLEENLKQKKNQVTTMEKEIRKLSSLPSMEDLIKEKQILNDSVVELTDEVYKLTARPSDDVQVSVEETKNIDVSYEKNLSAYRKRKRICMDIVDNIMDGYPKSKKKLIEEIGIETDDQVGFKI